MNLDSRVNAFYESLQGKRVAVCGIGISNTPLIEKLIGCGARITACDRREMCIRDSCGLPYYIGGTIGDKNALTLQTPDSFWNRFRIEVRVRHEVTAVDLSLIHI